MFEKITKQAVLQITNQIYLALQSSKYLNNIEFQHISMHHAFNFCMDVKVVDVYS